MAAYFNQRSTIARVARTYNGTFVIGWVSFSEISLMLAESFVLHIYISGKKPAHRKSEIR